jgi:hypothetical protein
MSNYFKSAAASDVADAFRARATGISVIDPASAVRTGMTRTALKNAVFGKGHPPQGIPL